MNTLYYDAEVSDDIRCQQLYDGQLFVYAPIPSSLALVEHARALAEAAFAPLDPRKAQDELAVLFFAWAIAAITFVIISSITASVYRMILCCPRVGTRSTFIIMTSPVGRLPSSIQA